jgi:hypothetical protein
MNIGKSITFKRVEKAYEATRNAYGHHLKEAKRLKDKPVYQHVSVDRREVYIYPTFLIRAVMRSYPPSERRVTSVSY